MPGLAYVPVVLAPPSWSDAVGDGFGIALTVCCSAKSLILGRSGWVGLGGGWTTLGCPILNSGPALSASTFADHCAKLGEGFKKSPDSTLRTAL